jgi:hypothetical protein
MSQRHDANQASHVQAGSGGIKPDITGDPVAFQIVIQLGGMGYRIYKSPLFQH